jgi:hypothetical protein
MIDYRILPEHRLIVICLFGDVSVDDIIANSLTLRSDPDYSPDYDSLVDNKLLEHTFTAEEIHRLSSRNMDQDTSGRIAVVAPNAVIFGMSRMYQILTDSDNEEQSHIFRDIHSALTWLDRRDLDIDPIREELRKR